MRKQQSQRNPIVRNATSKPVKAIRYSEAMQNIDNWMAHGQELTRRLQKIAEDTKRKRLHRRARQSARTRQRKQLKQKIRRSIAVSIPLVTVIGYLAFRLYGVTRTFSH